MRIDFDEIIDRSGTDSIKWELFPPDVLPMWVADMDFRVPEHITLALRKAVDHAVFGYTWDSKTLRQSVVDRMDRLYRWKVDIDSIVTVTGLVSGFTAAANALCGPDDGYIVQQPVYYPFNQVQESTGAYRQNSPLVPKFNGRTVEFNIDWERFNQTFHTDGHRTKMFLLCSPHNPVGKMYDREELAKMAQKCLEEEVVIVSDEIHSELILSDKKHIPIASLSPEIEQNTITLVSPSKTFNIAGLFCGFAIIPNPRLREKYKRAVENMTLHVSSLAFPATLAAFSGECDPWLSELLDYLRTNRDITVKFLDEHVPGTVFTVPDATYLQWIGFQNYIDSGKMSGDPSKWLVEHAKVGLNSGNAFGEGGRTYARLNFATSRPTLMDGLKRIERALR